MNNKENIDKILAFILIKKLLTPINSTEAFKKGFIDNSGKIIKIPAKDEQEYLTLLDKLIFKLKRMIGSRITELNNFMYVKNMDDSVYNLLKTTGNVDQRVGILRLKKDLNEVLDKWNINEDNLIGILLNEQLTKDKYAE